jgi:ferredoxin-type protein NapF
MDVSRRASSPNPTRRRLFGFASASTGTNAEAPQVAAIAASCLSLNGTSCRICAEHCEVGAIRFRLELGGRARPSVGESCDGCAACLPVCPVGAVFLIAKPEAAPCA